MMIPQKNETYSRFLANISLVVAKVSVAVYLVKQTPPSISSYDFVRFLQNQYMRREDEKEALINYYFSNEKQPSDHNSNCEISFKMGTKTTDLSTYTAFSLSQLKMTKFNLQNIMFFTNQTANQLKYYLREILSSSYNILFHAFKANCGKGLISSRKLNTFLSMKQDAEFTFRLWINKTMELLNENPESLIQCLDILRKFVVSKDFSAETDSLWDSTILELNLILSSSFKAHLNTLYRTSIAHFTTEFVDDVLKKLCEKFQTLASNHGKMLFLQVSKCAHIIWLSVNLLKSFDDDDQIFDRKQASQWVQILDRWLEAQKASTNQTERFSMAQLTGLMFTIFVLKNKIIRLTAKF
ncbi:hypothetical protein MS3_00009197 [Schistosoma haematobium]|uniref:Uncharacterized protein n=2 Tax=Schistosoma haematobium TaxID=6185 RepID=A0A922S5U6_SCHHA|nr:hypothetical protein MS3_00009197 [Schistosoma haematobium]KAH9594904.1 hypothetical protein MS3_00009197 [Schistosoma haematobium]